MTKKAMVKELYDAGMTSVKELSVKTGLSYGHVSGYVYQIRHPEKFKQDHARCVKNWESKNSDKRKDIEKKWRANHPEKVSKQKTRQYYGHQKTTKALATKHRQEWLLQDIEYLKVNAHEQSAHQIALVLGRTYKSVIDAAQKFGINLHGQKMGREFVGIYKTEEQAKEIEPIK